MRKIFYHFPSNEKLNINDNLNEIIGGKGSSLQIISNLGINIPEGFTISSDICKYFYKNNQKFPEFFFEKLKEEIQKLEKISGKNYGSNENTLLLSVRSGAQFSMPGMMDTVLNLGLNCNIVSQLVIKTNNLHFVYDSYSRFIQLFSNIIYSIPSAIFDVKFKEIQKKHNLFDQENYSEKFYKEVISEFKSLVKEHTNREFEEDPWLQLKEAVIAVIKSWNSPRAKIYRHMHNIDNNIGTAVNIQSMVFGNLNNKSATGVVFSRNPINGDDELYGEYLINAQGEDIVSGTRTPLYISGNNDSMENTMPEVFAELKLVSKKLENHFKDMQDIEFTVENGKLYILQTRSGKRTAKANIKISYDLFKNKIINKEELILQIETDKIDNLLHSSINNTQNIKPIAIGLPASPGAASGIIALSSHEVEEMQKKYSNSKNIILVRNDTSPEDIKGMSIASAIITARGGLTSHAAVVARGIGKACICGVSDITINEKENYIKINDKIYHSGDIISMDGSKGEIYDQNMKITSSDLPEEFLEILEYANDIKKLSVRANAETFEDVKAALEFGANGIGLCRTEHMFFDPEKIILFQCMILESSIEKRESILKNLQKFHKEDFLNIFKLLKDKPFNIRLLDPPIHEFLPKTDLEIQKISKILNISKEITKEKISTYTESNPMLGHRGCRLGITHEDIYRMQIRAIFEAAYDFFETSQITPNIEIMIPLISTEEELIILRNMIKDEEFIISKKRKYELKYKIGTMIELPRSIVISDELAKHVDFFSYGTNDLTQTIFGISRDDVSSFMHEYRSKSIFKFDPFVRIDEKAVGSLIESSVIKGRKTNKDISIGVCGEHGGDPESIRFFDRINVDYISCSPYRIYKARIAAAQAYIKNSI